ncbi:hypothetical protein Ari01nite_32320 [Paractinoplanes rishiriensis]|uniref:Uncharacterized protein n=1 Tax=Paractinoplanes rishiriensis TaxID=1050105 RepID=A0A919N103_9ACTN|nr:hypothetical protein Ari01nite_32320 [Actinoplanes rishiriensis]
MIGQSDLPRKKLPVGVQDRDQRHRDVNETLNQNSDPVERGVSPRSEPEAAHRTQPRRISENASRRLFDQVSPQHK